MHFSRHYRHAPLNLFLPTGAWTLLLEDFLREPRAPALRRVGGDPGAVLHPELRGLSGLRTFAIGTLKSVPPRGGAAHPDARSLEFCTEQSSSPAALSCNPSTHPRLPHLSRGVGGAKAGGIPGSESLTPQCHVAPLS